MSSSLKETEQVEEKSAPKIKKETVLIIILCVLLGLALFLPSNNSFTSLLKLENVASEKESESYASVVESNLEKVLCEISGVGEVKVVVNALGSEKEILAKNVITTEENGVIKVSETIVTVSGKPYVISVENPKIKSVIVVCDGADDLSLKLKIAEVVSSYLDVSASDIKIYKRK